MPAFINGIGMISPQKTAETTGFLTDIVSCESEYLKCIDPVYKNYIDPVAGRRMSRLIKMGISSAKMCIADSGNIQPDAIITGTGLGSVEDTEKILHTLKEDENFFNPTPFIQSTYNTISSQIAINLKCHGYNSTYVHRIFSFESCLQDALMQIEDKEANSVLAGGIDEMTLNHLAITKRAGHWKTGLMSNTGILQNNSPGAMAGEGSAYFLLSSEKSPSTYARLVGTETFFYPDNNFPFREKTSSFLEKRGISPGEIDYLLLGLNGDNRFDNVYYNFRDEIFPETPSGYFKHLCGEYHTSSGFALWLAANIIKQQNVPEIINLNKNPEAPIRNILIYNQYMGINHSLMLVSV